LRRPKIFTCEFCEGPIFQVQLKMITPPFHGALKISPVFRRHAKKRRPHPKGQDRRLFYRQDFCLRKFPRSYSFSIFQISRKEILRPATIIFR